MKEKHLSLSATFGPVILYREDLEEIIKIFSKASNNGIKLYDATYKYDFFEELASEHPDRINYFAIKCVGEPYVTLSLTSRSPAVELSAPNRESAEAVFFKLKDLLASRVRLLPKIIFYAVICLSIIGIIASIILPLLALTFVYSFLWLAGIPKWIFLILGITTGIILSVGIAFIKYADSGKMSYISTKHRKDRSGFYKQNKDLIDKIIVGVITAIIGGIVGAWLKK
jgi:hypothetical protein